MTKWEVDIRSRKTGNTIETIFSGDHDDACEVLEKWYKLHPELDMEKCLTDYVDGSDGVFADIYAKEEEHMSFINDVDKMKDFEALTKAEFLLSYSYLTEKEYNDTMLEYIKRQTDKIHDVKEATVVAIEKAKNNKETCFKKFVSDLKELARYTESINEVVVDTKAERKYADGTVAGCYKLAFRAGCEYVCVYGENGNSFYGRIPFNGEYKDKEKWHSNLHFDLDEIVKKWDKEWFESKLFEAIKAKLNNDMENALTKYGMVVGGV